MMDADRKSRAGKWTEFALFTLHLLRIPPFFLFCNVAADRDWL